MMMVVSHRRAFDSPAPLVFVVIGHHHSGVSAALFRGVFGPGGSSFSLVGSSSSARHRDLGILRGRFSPYYRRGCPICRSLSLLFVHRALINVLLAAASTSQHQGKDREESQGIALSHCLPHRL
ncbi:MAG: hypothetical protein ABSA09_10630, partial [Desulfobaccales bacterium]